MKHYDYEQYSRRNSLRISGLEEDQSEDVPQKVLDLFNDKMKVSPPVTPYHIHRIHRTGPEKTGVPRQVLVKFATYRVRDKVFRSKRNLKEETSHVPSPQTAPSSNYETSKQKMFLNEDLTRARSNLLWRARLLKKDKVISDCWSWIGTILIKNTAGKIIRSVSELPSV